MRTFVCVCLFFGILLEATAKPSLHELVIQGDETQVAGVIKKKKVNKLDKKGNAPLHYAAAHAEPGIAQLLIDNGADVNILNKKYRTTPLHEVARTVERDRKQIRETTRVLLESGADPDFVDGHGETPILAASRSGNALVVKIILELRPDSASGAEVVEALLTAREHGRYAVIDLLEGRGVKSDSGKELGLLNAADLGNFAVIDNLIRSGTNLETTSDAGETPLILAAAEGHTEVVRYLLDNEAEVNARSNYGRTALHAAAEHGFLDIIELLVASEADISANSDKLGTPINSAAEKERVNIINYLLEQGATSGTVSETADNAFGSGLGWLIYADYHEKTVSEGTTEESRTVAKEMLEIARVKFEEQRLRYEELKRKEKRSDAITEVVGTVIAVAVVASLEYMQQQHAQGLRKQTAQIMALKGATSYEDYHARYAFYKAIMLRTEPETNTQIPYRVDIGDTSLTNIESISGLDVIISEYERRIALTNKLLDGI